MKWSKTGKRYSVSCNDSGTIFNLNGLEVKQPVMTQYQANQFLNQNGYESFDVDIVKKRPKKKIIEKSLIED